VYVPHTLLCNTRHPYLRSISAGRPASEIAFHAVAHTGRLPPGQLFQVDVIRFPTLFVHFPHTDLGHKRRGATLGPLTLPTEAAAPQEGKQIPKRERNAAGHFGALKAKNFITNNDRAELFLHQVFDAWQLKVWFATFHSDRNFETIRTALKARRNEANQRRKAQRNANAQGREIGDFKTETWQRERGHAKQQRRERQFRCEVHLEVQANNAKAQQT
jgi:hypothetical protein